MTLRFDSVSPPLRAMSIWRAYAKPYSFVIVQERMSNDCIGFTATYKNLEAPYHDPIKIDGGPWDAYVEAERACNDTLKQLRNKN